MTEATALKVAIQLLHTPSNVRMVRDHPLPPELAFLLRIAAAEPEALKRGVEISERSPDIIVRASRFFIEQAMWFPKADSYRVLGSSPNASALELKRNMSLLMAWLHPDRDPEDDRSIFVMRVTAAWNDLKTPDRRARYANALQQNVDVEISQRRNWTRRQRHLTVAEASRGTLIQRIMSFLLRASR